MKLLKKLKTMIESVNTGDEQEYKVWEEEEVKLDINSTTHGVLSANRIPNLDSGKITSGVLSANRIPNLDSGKITSGVLNIARIPQVPWSKVSDKPSTFTPAAHNQAWSTITGPPAQATRWPAWSEVTSRPSDSQFPNTAQQIGASQNLNNYTTPGFYYQNANANAANGSNYPVAEAGTLVVTKDAGTTQMYYHYNGNGVYYRTFYSSKWTAWKNLLTPTWANVSGKPSTFAPSAHTHTASQISGLPTGATNMTSNRVQFGNIKMCWGMTRVTVTAANTRASLDVTLPISFSSAANMRPFLQVEGAAPERVRATVTRIAVNKIRIYLWRDNADWNDIHWFVIGT